MTSPRDRVLAEVDALAEETAAFTSEMVRIPTVNPPGDLYEDCAYHPVLCLGADYENDDLWGISLVDGSYPRSCSFIHCGVRKLTPKQAWLIKTRGPIDAKDRKKIPAERRWWTAGSARASSMKVRRVGPPKL